MLWEWENSANRVYILDLDGTLMPTAEIDNICFWQAVSAVFDTPDHPPDLHDFEHVTDSGILHEWCVREMGRPPRVDEAARVKLIFEQRLEFAFRAQPADFDPMPGVKRTDIMRIAALRTLGHAATENTAFTYVGDGVWDLRASRELDWAFVGIASGARALLLESAGAAVVRENFCKT